MEVIATIQGGFLIQATASEISEILNAVNGKKPEKIEIGQKIPAIDYAATITKIKSLKNNHDYMYLLTKFGEVERQINAFKEAVESASSITV